jgi:hypothetical protein
VRPRAGRLLAGLVALVALDAAAHGRSVSHSRWWLTPTGARAEVRLAARDAAQRGLGDPGAYAATRLVLSVDGVPCEPGRPAPLAAPAEWLAFGWSLACPAGDATVLENRLFDEGAGARLHFARFELADGTRVERMFGPGDVRETVTAPEAAARDDPVPGFGRFVALGVEHILSGWDHLAFLLGLLVLAAGLRDVLVLATGFTLGHSVTLALSVLGVARPQQAGVEALIGFSILLVAAENVWQLGRRGVAVPALVVGALLGLAVIHAGVVPPLSLVGLALFAACHFALLARTARPARVRALVATGFGLVHGFGFAGILHDLALPRPALLPALLGFNAGVELGQLVVIALVWPAFRVLTRALPGGGERRVAEVTSAGLAAVGTFWFVGRLFG